MPAIITCRPQTGLSFLAPEPEDVEDLYSRYKVLYLYLNLCYWKLLTKTYGLNIKFHKKIIEFYYSIVLFIQPLNSLKQDFHLTWMTENILRHVPHLDYVQPVHFSNLLPIWMVFFMPYMIYIISDQ